MSVSKESFVGSLIDGRYLVEEELGAGGIGVVYLARDLKVLGRSVVVKVLLEESFRNEYVVKKFRQEAEALSRLDHPSIVDIFDFGEMAGGQPYLVLRFIDGVPLRSAIRPGGMDLVRAGQIVREVASALTAAHGKGVLHRDLKPENVMLQTHAGEERVVVIDFGIARVQDSIIAPKTALGTGAAGTIHYMSPEQLTADELTPASDTYALGVIAYELVTGRRPFAPKTPYQLLELQRAGLTVKPRELRPDLPEAAENAILKALAFDPAERHRRTRDFGEAVCRALFCAPGEAAGVYHTDAKVARGGATGAPPNLTAPASYATTPNEPSRAPAPVNPENAPTRYLSEAVPEETLVPPRAAAAAHEAKRKTFSPLLIALLVFVLAGGLSFAAWKLLRPQAAHDVVPPPVAEATTAETILNYSLTVQRMRDGKEFKEPFQSTGREIFENGWRFRLNVSPQKPGYLYLINEGLDDRGETVYTILFPVDGDARLPADQAVQLPDSSRHYEFTGEAGTEKIWLVWAGRPVRELEALKGLVNPEDQGEISRPAQIASVRGFLAAHAAAKPEVVRDAANKQTSIKAAGDVVVHLAELEHH